MKNKVIQFAVLSGKYGTLSPRYRYVGEIVFAIFPSTHVYLFVFCRTMLIISTFFSFIPTNWDLKIVIVQNGQWRLPNTLFTCNAKRIFSFLFFSFTEFVKMMTSKWWPGNIPHQDSNIPALFHPFRTTTWQKYDQLLYQGDT